MSETGRTALAAGLNQQRGEGGGEGEGEVGAGKRRRTKDEDDGPVRRSLRGMNIPPDAALANGVDVERRNGRTRLFTHDTFSLNLRLERGKYVLFYWL